MLWWPVFALDPIDQQPSGKLVTRILRGRCGAFARWAIPVQKASSIVILFDHVIWRALARTYFHRLRAALDVHALVAFVG